MEAGENKEIETPLDRLYSLARLIRDARSETDVTLVEEKIDNILEQELARYSKGGFEAGDAAALSLAAHRLKHLITHRRSTFAPSVVELKSAETAYSELVLFRRIAPSGFLAEKMFIVVALYAIVLWLLFSKFELVRFGWVSASYMASF